MFEPDGTDPLSNQWLELKNVGDAAFDFAGVALVSGVRLSLHDMHPLEPNQFLVIAKSPALFLRKYGFAASNDAPFERTLSSSSDVIEIFRGRNRLLKFRYGGRAPWPRTARGFGFSLTLRRPDASSFALLSYSVTWRASAYRGGSPGFDDPAPPWASVPPLQITELFAHTDPPLVDALELYNPTNATVDLTGFSISDQPDPLGWRRFAFPFETNETTVQIAENITLVVPRERLAEIGPGQRISISELKLKFRLSSLGQSVYLFYAEAPDHVRPTGFVDGVEYGAIDNGIAQVRRRNSIGEPVWVRAVWSPDEPEGERLPSPAAIASLLYRPPSQFNGAEDLSLEYIEIVNLRDRPLPLWDEGVRGGQPYYNTWRIESRDNLLAPSFEFPRNVTLAVGESLLVVSVAPAVFRAASGVRASVQVYGPWLNGPLPNDMLRLALLFPDQANADFTVPYVVADELEYSAEAPWPRLTVATAGRPLLRINASEIGDEPRNWRFAEPGEERAFVNSGNDEGDVVPRALLLLLLALGSTELA